MNIKLPFCLLLFITLFTQAQERQLSTDAEVSVLTFGPGNSLIDSFGHNAFRIKDKINYLDVVFNYGSFDFDTPNFYLKFAQGQLNYKIEDNSYSKTFEYYVAQNRAVEEQILNLTQEQKQEVFNFLVHNSKPENKYYLYDFFFDNCATKIKDVLKTSINQDISFNSPESLSPRSFRALIHSHVNKNSWGSLGIDVALGSVIDKEASPEEHMFLPTYIYQFFKNASFINSNEKLVKQSRILFRKVDKPVSSSFFTSPLMVFGLIGLIIMVITYRDYKKNRRSKYLDFIIFAVTGLIGVVLLLLWFATDHSTTANNYNLLWGFPINLFVIGQLLKPSVSSWFKKYLKFLIIMLCLLTLHWIIGVQVFAIGLIPLLIAIAIRYIYLVSYFEKNAK